MTAAYPLKLSDINIRDPFVLAENGVYYMYGTRGANFGITTGGFDVYKSTDLVNWTRARQVFYSEKYNMNRAVNWAPEVHKFNGKYYMCATFTRSDPDLRGTHILVADAPDSEFIPHSGGSITPEDWYALDGTLFFEEDTPYMVFCHEHVQIMDGTVEYIRLDDCLKNAATEPVTLFHGSDAYSIRSREDGRYVTDGPFLYMGNERLYMIWSTCAESKYVQCCAYSESGKPTGPWVQLPHIFSEDGGHGMIFRTFDGELMLVLHRPNKQTFERPYFIPIAETDGRLVTL